MSELKKPAERQLRSPSAGDSGWQDTAAHILDAGGGGARVGTIRLTNCAAGEPADAIAEIQATQAMNRRAKGDKTYHLVVSFPAGERPTEAQLAQIEATLCASIGLGDHQRISAVHKDTDHLHIHVAINKVHPTTGRYVEPYYDHPKLMAACERLEIQHGLQRTNHGQHEGQDMRGRGSDMEAHAGQEALTSWVKANALADIQSCLRTGQSWQDLHNVLAAYDLEIRPRGAGLVIATADGKVMARASRFSKALSMGSLAKRWGRYQAATGPKPTAKMGYVPAPKLKSALSAQLWSAYQDGRKAAQESRAAGAERRTAAFQQFNAERSQRREALRDWYDARARGLMKVGGVTAAGREALWGKLRLEHAVKDREEAEWGRDRKAEIDRANPLAPLPTWFEFLQTRAANGNVEALRILRLKQEQNAKASAALLAAADETEARHVVFSALSPIARKNGTMVYNVKDGGEVHDQAGAVWIVKETPHAMFLGLCLMAERAPNNVVPEFSGDDAFKRRMVESAAATKIDLTFADPALEALRRQLRGLPEPAAPGLVGAVKSLFAAFGRGKPKGRRP